MRAERTNGDCSGSEPPLLLDCLIPLKTVSCQNRSPPGSGQNVAVVVASVLKNPANKDGQVVAQKLVSTGVERVKSKYPTALPGWSVAVSAMRYLTPGCTPDGKNEQTNYQWLFSYLTLRTRALPHSRQVDKQHLKRYSSLQPS